MPGLWNVDIVTSTKVSIPSDLGILSVDPFLCIASMPCIASYKHETTKCIYESLSSLSAKRKGTNLHSYTPPPLKKKKAFRMSQKEI